VQASIPVASMVLEELEMYRACYTTWFSAAQYIRGHPRGGSRIHGHNYRVRVCVSGEKLDEYGMLIDYYDLRDIVEEVVQPLDHQFLNQVLGVEAITSERLAKLFYNKIRKRLPERLALEYVEVCPTDDFCTSYSQ